MPAQNHLIERLPRASQARLLKAGQSVQVDHGQVLAVQGSLLRQVYFPIDGAIAMTVRADAHPGLEVGLIGREGMLGAHWLLGVGSAPTHAVVQSPGMAWRLDCAAFQRELAQGSALRRVLSRYLVVRIEQLALAVACRRFHLIGPRLARWLLMSQDRAELPHFQITHERLAEMLGVRRVGITVAAGELQRRGLIRYHRGELSVLDRGGLEATACSCYASDRSAYARRME